MIQILTAPTVNKQYRISCVCKIAKFIRLKTSIIYETLTHLLKHCLYGYFTSLLKKANKHLCHHDRLGNWETKIPGSTLFLAMSLFTVIKFSNL